MSQVILVVEPHADDAFLSLGGHIEDWVKTKCPVVIITVFSGTRKRARDAATYAEAVGAGWVGLGAREPDDGGSTGEGQQALLTTLPKVLRAYPGRVLGPLGIKHPDHVAVRETLRKLLARSLDLYLDQPYGATQSNKEEVNQKLAGKMVLSYLRPHARKYRHVGLFKDQSKFFHFNPPEKLAPNIELIVR